MLVNTALCLWLSVRAIYVKMIWNQVACCGCLDGGKTLRQYWGGGVVCLLISTGYVVLEDNSRLSKALEDKRLPETLFRTLSADNHGTTKTPLHLFVKLCLKKYT